MIFPIWAIFCAVTIVALPRQFAPNGADLPGTNATVSQGRTLLPIDGGWARFRFTIMGPAVTYMVPTGYFGTIELVVTDAFCPGDSFSVFLNDQRLVLQTPLVPGSSTPCAIEISDPEAAMRDPAFSSARARFAVQSGDKITVAPRASAVSAGRAFLRASSLLQTLTIGDDDLSVVTSPRVPRRMAAGICNLLGSRLAYPDDQDLNEALVRSNLQGRSVWTAASSGSFQGNCPTYAVDRSGRLVAGSTSCDDGLVIACSRGL